MLKSIKILSLIIILCTYSSAQNETINIWPGLAPGTENRENTEHKDGNNVVEVYQPDLTIMLPDNPDSKKPAIMVFPGGGYNKVVMKKEGYDIGKWFNDHGVAAFILKYRLRPDEALADAQRALSLVRQNAGKYNIDPDKIGVIGFSAGGHLAANISTHYNKEEMNDKIDSVSCKPDYEILVYGAGRQFIDDIDEDTPPTFLVHAGDDSKVPVTFSVNFYLKLKEENVPAEMHIYEQGEHGFALVPERGYVYSWGERCIDWLKIRGILAETK